MKIKLFTLAIFLTLIFTFSIFSQNNSTEKRQRIYEPTIPKPQETVFELEKKAFLLINEIRRKNGMKDLIWSDQVANIARQHSQSMATNKFFSHRGLDGSMIDDRADAVGLKKWWAIGENIAFNRGYAKPAEFAVECWMDSQGHRRNLLDARWRETGVGVAVNSDGSYYFTQVFLWRRN